MKRLASLLLVLALTGCATIPTSGPVVQVQESQAPQPDRGADIAPGPPLKGASPDQLVAGFLVAIAAGQPGFSVARKYLTKEADRAWSPEAHGVQIYADQHPPRSTADSARIDAPLVGAIDASGRYSSVSGRVAHDFKMVRVDGELRIDSPPQGLLISRYMFGRFYSAYPIYFLNTHQTLVPELVHLPSAQLTPRVLLNALMRGPSGWLRPSVITAFPENASLISTRLDDTNAYVDFGSEIERLPEEDRRRLGAQVLWTLTSFPRVGAVTITVNGSPYSISGQSETGALELVNQQGVQALSAAQTTDLFAVRAGGLGQVGDDGKFIPVGGALGKANTVGAFAVSMDGTGVSAIDSTGTRLMVGATGGTVTPVQTGFASMSRVQIVQGMTWVLGTTAVGAQSLIRIDQHRAIQAIGLPSSLGAVRSFSVGPAGTRIAIVSQDGSLWMGRLEERGDGVAVAGEFEIRPMPTADGAVLTDMAAVGWSGEMSLIVLAATVQNDARLAYQLSVDGASSVGLGPIGDYNLVMGSVLPRRSGVSAVVMNADGRVLRYESRVRWRVLGVAGLTHVAYAG